MENIKDHIVSDPNILFGKPTFKGTRIPVDLILEMLSNNLDYNEILEAYPQLTKISIMAALAFASESLKTEVIKKVAS
tara:strand:- start:615 stop:848 length:234 start_codon:yes stop_codon:yes gene_type:complete